MRTSPSPSERACGFTLIELLVVLAIMALLIVVAAPRIARRPQGIVRREAAATIGSALEAVRRQALLGGSPQALAIATILPAARYAPQSDVAAPGSIVFYPDGSTSGGTISLDNRPLVTIGWLTGAIDAAR